MQKLLVPLKILSIGRIAEKLKLSYVAKVMKYFSHCEKFSSFLQS